MAYYQVLYWHDIPTQVRAREGRNRASCPLPDRFMEAVDQAAMAARLTGSDAYVDGFHWGEMHERAGDPETVATAVAAEVAAQYQDIPWRELATRLRNMVA